MLQKNNSFLWVRLSTFSVSLIFNDKLTIAVKKQMIESTMPKISSNRSNVNNNIPAGIWYQTFRTLFDKDNDCPNTDSPEDDDNIFNHTI